MTPSPTAIRRRAPLAVALALLVAAVLAVAACGGDSSSGSSAGTSATYVPADSPVYFEVSTDLDGPQWTEIQALAQRFPAYPELQRSLQEALTSGTVDFNSEIRPLLGDRAAVAFTSLGDVAKVAGASGVGTAATSATASASANVLGVVDLADGKREDAEAVLVKAGGTAAGEHDGASLFAGPGGESDMVIAVTDDALVVADNRAQVIAALDAHKAGGDKTLAGTAKFTDTLGKLPQDVVGQMYLDIGAVAASGGEAFPQVLQFGGVGDVQNGVMGASLIAEPDGLRVKGVATGIDAYTKLTAFSPSLAAHAPADALAFFEVANVTDVIRGEFATFTAEGDPETTEQISAFADTIPQLLGVTVDQLAALGSGRQALAVLPSGGDIPGFAILLQVEKGAEAQSTLDAVRTATPQLLGMFSGDSGANVPAWKAVTLPGGVDGWQLELEPGLGVVYAVDGDLAVIGTTPAAVGAVLNPASPLADSADFAAGTAGMPDSVTTLSWLNVPQIASVADAMGAFADAPPEAIANIRPLRSVSRWDTGGSEPTFEAFIRITE